VINLREGLGEYKDRNITLRSPDQDLFNITASEGELKQVLLNLTLNALQSLNGSTGQVNIELHRENGAIQLTVSDNGRGMTSAVLDRIFEPSSPPSAASAPPAPALASPSPT